MAVFGMNPFPRRFGGGKRAFQVALEAILDAAAPGWDTTSTGAFYAEAYSHAILVGMIWAVQGRLKQQGLPSGMLEAIPDWETILRLNPLPGDSVPVRRARIAAKLLGLASNTIGAINDAVSALAGSTFLGLSVPDSAHEWVYWPGVNPGPPGFEWSTNRAIITVRLRHAGTGDAAFLSLEKQIADLLESMLPAWMSYVVGVDSGSGFVADIGIADLTLI